MHRYRVAFITSHPVPYQSGLLRAVALHPKVDLTVYFCSDFGVNKKEFDPLFNAPIDWGKGALGGFSHVFLRNYSRRRIPDFWGLINPGIFHIIFRNHFDAVIVHGWNAPTNWIAFAACLLTRTPFFFRSETPHMHEKTKRGLKGWVRNVILNIAFSCAAGFLAVGKENKAFYIAHGVPEEKIFFVPYAIDNAKFMAEADAAPSKSELKRALGIAPEAVVLLSNAKFIHQKRPMDLLRAFESVAGENRVLVFLSDGELKGEIMRYIEARKIPGVHFAGFVHPSEISRYYAAADFLVLASGAGETWGLVVNEAMCFGLPVIVSDMVGCAPDLVREEENGFIFRCGDVAGLAARMRTLFEEPEYRKRLGAASRRIISGYNYEVGRDGFVGALERCAHRHS